MKAIKKEFEFGTDRHHKVTIAMEQYDNGGELIRTCKSRKKNPDFSEDRFGGYRVSKSFEGVSSMNEACELLSYGWSDKVEEVDSYIKAERKCYTDKLCSFKPDVAGFMPIVPNAIMGLPNSMLNQKMAPKKNKVIDIIYLNSFSCGVSTDQIMKAGMDVVKYIVKLESQGFRVRLMSVQGYCSHDYVNILATVCKNEAQPLDVKRTMFPMFHPGMFRAIGFGWYERFPEGKYISSYGYPFSVEFSSEEVDMMAKDLFSRNAVVLDGTIVLRQGEEYIKSRLEGIKR